MKPKHYLLRALACLALSCLVLISIDSFLNNQQTPSSSGGVSDLIERVRTHGIKDRITETRRIGTSPSWLKQDIDRLIYMLDSGLGADGDELTVTQVMNAIKALGNAGKDGVSGTAALKKIILSEDDISLRKEALLAMTRIKSVPESVSEITKTLCDQNDPNNSECLYKQLITLRYQDVLLEKGDVNMSDKLEQLESFPRQILANGADQKNDVSLDVLDENDRELFFQMSLYGKLSDKTKRKLLELAQSEKNLEARIAAINVLSDQVDVPGFVIEELSNLMQYDAKYQVREEALLALRRVASEQSLGVIHAYGHKFSQGEVKPVAQQVHPFLQWALEQKELMEETERE